MAKQVTAIISCMTVEERPFIRKAVESVLNQTIDCVVHLYVTDTNNWIDDVLVGLDKIDITRVPLMSIGAIRNLGVKESETEFVAFLDGDDFWLPTKIEKQISALRQTGATLAGADHRIVDQNGRHFAYGTAKYFPMTSSWLVNRQFIAEHPFDEHKLKGEEDGDWWILTAGKAPRVRVPEFLIAYRVRDKSLSSGSKGKQKKELAWKVARMPGMRLIVLASSFILNRIHKKSEYLWHPTWVETHSMDD